jgi:hypothetical protein
MSIVLDFPKEHFVNEAGETNFGNMITWAYFQIKKIDREKHPRIKQASLRTNWLQIQ